MRWKPETEVMNSVGAQSVDVEELKTQRRCQRVRQWGEMRWMKTHRGRVT